MISFYIILVIILATSAYGVIEFARHRRLVKKIPIRIHINGTRGKSSVTRLIGAGLRAGGIRTITKVTGTYPRMNLHDGSEVRIHRRGDANIIEQISIVRLAAEEESQALVVECMALEPQYQWITEHQMIKATVGVITNVRMDHIEIMGDSLDRIAAALGETIPTGGHFFTAETSLSHFLHPIAEKRRSSMRVTRPNEVSDDEMKGFPYIEHRENVSLSLAICEHLGINRSVALAGMYKARPDAGALQRFCVDRASKRIVFYNAFAANDPDSTFMVWDKLRKDNGFEGNRIVLLNTRHDRLDRARQLAQMIGKRLQNEVHSVVLIGHCTGLVRNMLLQNGIERRLIVTLGWTTPAAVYEKALALTERASTIVGIGNMGGMGAAVADHFELRSQTNHD